MTGSRSSDAEDGIGDYRVNGHEFEVTTSFEGSEIVQCIECLVKDRLDEDDDPDDHLGLMTPECHIEWLRAPDGGFHGIALRNASGFSGRELIGVREGGETGHGEVVDSVRVYDKDASLLAALLDQRNWEETEGSE